MARPWKHPKTGIYWLRRGVPQDLRQLVGKREELKSLATRNPDEARRLHTRAMAELEERWANLRAGPKVLSLAEAHALAGCVHTGWMERYDEKPASQKAWRTDLYVRLWDPLFGMDLADPNAPWRQSTWIDVDLMPTREMERWCEAYAGKLLEESGLVVDEASRAKLARAVASVSQQACLALHRRARGEFDAFEPWLGTPSSGRVEVLGKKIGPALTFEEALELWIAEKQPGTKTRYDWRRNMAQLAAHVGHTDAHRLTPENLIAWKATLLSASLSAKTIRDGRLAPVRAILQCAVDNRKMATTPAERVGIDVKAVGGQSRRSFTDKEAAMVLKAALGEKNPVLRWVPWLCAYSGARVSEVCQLRVNAARNLVLPQSVLRRLVKSEQGRVGAEGRSRRGRTSCA